MVGVFETRGWAGFGPDQRLLEWVRAARPAARQAVADPAFAQWHQCEGTWFVGVDALPNDAQGRIGSGPVLGGDAVDFIKVGIGPVPPLHRAQCSVVYPGYPRPRTGEGQAAFGYRMRRDAAHVDGILAVGEARQRMLREPHAWILGIPLSRANDLAAPLVVWEGSHRIMQAAFRAAFEGQPPQAWGDLDITGAYQAARRTVFEQCRRVVVTGQPGEAYLVHRLALHGVAPWGSAGQAEADGRMIAYFRPPMPGGAAAWLDAP